MDAEANSTVQVGMSNHCQLSKSIVVFLCSTFTLWELYESLVYFIKYCILIYYTCSWFTGASKNNYHD